MNPWRFLKSLFAWRLVDRIGAVEYWVNGVTLERRARCQHVGRVHFMGNSDWIEGRVDNPRCSLVPKGPPPAPQPSRPCRHN